MAFELVHLLAGIFEAFHKKAEVALPILGLSRIGVLALYRAEGTLEVWQGFMLELLQLILQLLLLGRALGAAEQALEKLAFFLE